MFKLSFILALFLVSSTFCSTINYKRLEANTKTRMYPSEDLQSISSGTTFYFTTDFIDHLYLEISIPKNESTQFEVGVNSYAEEPSEQDIINGEFTQVADFTQATDDEENIYTYILTSFTDKNKPFITINIKNLQELEYFDILVKNGDIPIGVKVYNLPFNQEVTLEDEVETPLYFNVSLPEQIKEKKISFNIKVSKNKLSGAKFSVSGYNSYPDIQDFSKNLIEKKEDQESEEWEDGEYNVYKYSMDKIEGATYLLLNIETSYTVELNYVLAKVYSEDEEKKEGEKESEKEDGKEGEKESEKEDEKESEKDDKKEGEREIEEKPKPTKPEKESKGWPTSVIAILCVIIALIVFAIIFLVVKKICCKPKEVTSETIEKDFSPKESNELH